MSIQLCNVCGFGLVTPVYSSSSEISVSSIGDFIPERTIVYLCERCTHVQTNEIKNIEGYYDKEYQLLIDSEEEDQIYHVKNDKKIYRYDHQVETLLRLLDIPHRANVLDYGCGKATTLKKLVKIREDIKPFVFDVSNMYLPFWQKFVKEGQWATYSLNEKWYGDIDVVTSFFSLEHVASPQAMLKNIRCTLREGGFFYCIVPDILQNIADFVVVDHVNHFTRNSIKRLFQTSGFNVLKIDKTSHTSALIVIAQKSKETCSWEVSNLNSDECSDVSRRVRGMSDYWHDVSCQVNTYERTLSPETSFAIYGSGFYGTYIASCLRDYKSLQCFVDRDPFRQNKKLLDKPIISPEKMPNSIKNVLVGLNPNGAKKNIDMIKSWRNREINFFYI